MKQSFFKKVFSVVLVMTLTLGVFPARANAMQAQTTVNQGNITVQGTNSLGTLIGSEIEDQQEQASQIEQEYPVGYGVKDLTVDGNTATVEYVSLEKANLVVSLYTEDGLKMLTSGNATINPDETVAMVTLEGDIPDYFMVSAYLLDTYDFSPLCASYSTPMYTREMQELLVSTIDDYDADRVLNLDDDKTTNFAVYADDIKVIEPKVGANIVTRADDEAATYVIEKADENILNLQTGDVFAYAYGDGHILIAKVANLAVSGSTVTISGAELEMEEVFSHVKMEATGDAADVIVDDSTVDEGITFDGLSQEGTQTYSLRRFEGEGSVKNSLNYTADKKIKAKHDEVEVTVSLKGTIGMELNIDFDYYVSMTRQFMKFETDVGMKLAVSLSGKVEVELPLGDLSVMFFGVSIGFEPAVKLEVEGKVEFSSFVGFGIGYIYDNYVGLLYRDTTPKVEFDAKIEASVFLGIDMNPKIDILKGVIAKAELGAPIGLELKAKPTGTLMGDSADEGETIHGCKTCIDMTLKFKVELSAKIEFLKCESLSLKTKVKAIEAEIASFYWSLDHGDFGVGDCPYKKHRVTIQVKDTKGKLVPNATIGAIVNEDEQSVELGTTNGNGNLTVYLQAGNYTFSTVVAENGYSTNMMIEEACKVVMDLSAFADDYNTIFDKIDAEKIADRGTAIASGECGDQGDNVIWKLYDNGTLVISGKGAMKDYYWGDETPWCNYADTIHSVIITKGVSTIGAGAFEDLENLTSATIADGVISIKQDAFCYTSLSNVTIPDSVTSIGDRAFEFCDFASVKLPSQLSSIGSSAFAYCNSLDSVTIPENVTSIGQSAFECCWSLREVTILGNVNAIESSVFRECESLHSVSLPDSITSIGYCAFYKCNSLESINMPANLVSIGDYAFSNCSSLTQIVMPANVINIGKSAFSDCGLESVTIGTKVASIGEKAFAGNSQLSGIWVDSNNPVYCNDEKGVLYSKDKTVLIVAPSTLSRAYTVGSNVKTIEEFAFWITDEITGIWVDANNPAYSSDAYGVLFNKNKTVLIRAPGKLSGSYTIPESVSTIEAFAFRNCYDITSVTIPDSVTTMGRSTFYDCFGLEFVSMGNGITAIPDYAFYFSGLKSVTIPDSVTSIGDCAFTYCFDLNSVTIGTGVTSIGANAFYFFFNGSLTDVYYKGTEEQWNEIVIEAGNSELSWADFHYQSTAAEDIVDLIATDELSVMQNAAEIMSLRETKGGFVHEGQYGEEIVGNLTTKTASFSNLVPGAQYVLLVLKNTETEDVLTSDNLLYISQATADDDGNLVFTYIPREITEVSYVMACGASAENLEHAVITFPEMTAGKEPQAVEATVSYNGEVLTEGVDYIIVGTTCYTEAGEYVCYIRGINGYTGLVKCIYTVTKEIPGDIDGDQSVTQDDAVYLLLHTMFGEVFYPLEHAPADIDQNGTVNQDDAVYLLLHTMFGETFYPLNTPT